jgi:outer membrane cobalamin receptor
MQKTILVNTIVCAFIIAIVSNITAEEKAKTEPAKEREVVVTASRIETLLAEVPDVVQVISRQKIDELKPSTTRQLLEYITGPSIADGTGVGLPDRGVVSLNGLQPKYTLVLVDGVPLVTDHIHSGQNVNFIPPYMIERIEIMRGAGSAQYGSDAVGGVLNIITRKYTGTSEASVHVEGGSYNTKETGAAVFTGNDDMEVSAIINWKDTDGVKIKAPAHRVGQMGFEKFNNLEQVKVNFSKEWNAYASFNYVNYESTLRSNTVDGTFYQPVFGVNGTVSPDLQVFAKVSYSKWDSEADACNDRRLQPEMYTKWVIGDNNVLISGIDARRHEYVRTAVPEKIQDRAGCFAQYESKLGDIFGLTAAIRYDKVENIEGEFSPKIALLISPAENFRIRTSYAEGFHAPTVQELYEEGFGHGGTARRFGNPDLKPEYSKTYGLSIETEPMDTIQFSLYTYFSRIDDIIVPVYEGPWEKDPTVDVWRRRNIRKSEVYGIEAAANARLSEWLNLNTGYTYTDNRDLETGLQLPYKAGSSVFAQLNSTCKINNLKLSPFVTVRSVFDRSAWDWKPPAGTPRDNPNGLVTSLKDYTKVDAGLTMAFNKNTEVFVKVENIFGKDIELLDDAFMVIEGEPTVTVGVNWNMPLQK